MMNTIRIGVLSAHKGAANWIRLLQSINSHGNIIIDSLHGFTNEYYRSPKNIWQQALLRISTYLIYPLKCITHLLFLNNRYDAFIAVTSPFFLPSLCTLISRKPIIHLVNDLYPEALVLAGIVRRGSLWEKLLKAVSGYGIHHSSAVVYLSEEHRQISESEFGAHNNSHIIPPGAASNYFSSMPPKEHFPPVTFLYCGTLGLMHDTSTILDFLRTRKVPDKCRLEFRTSGARKTQFEKSITEELSIFVTNGIVTLGDALGDEEWKNKMLSSQVGLVFQGLGAEKVIFPSRVFGILAAGQAVLAVAPEQSGIGRLILDNDCGWIVAPGDLDALHRVFLEALHPEILQRKRNKAFRLGQEKFAVDKLAAEWCSVILDVVLPFKK